MDALVSSPLIIISAPCIIVTSPHTSVSAPCIIVTSPYTGVSAPCIIVTSPYTGVSSPGIKILKSNILVTSRIIYMVALTAFISVGPRWPANIYVIRGIRRTFTGIGKTFSGTIINMLKRCGVITIVSRFVTMVTIWIADH
jgi:hypothetical protein